MYIRYAFTSLKIAGRGAEHSGHLLSALFHWKSARERRLDHLWPWPCGKSLFHTGLDAECILLPFASVVPGISNVACRRSPLIDLCPSGQVCITAGCQHIHYAV